MGHANAINGFGAPPLQGACEGLGDGGGSARHRHPLLNQGER